MVAAVIDSGASRVALRARHQRGTLDPVIAATLDSVEPGWSVSHATRSRSADIAELTNFIAREHHSDVPAAHVENGRAIGTFAARQRADHADARLTAGDTRELEAISGWSWSAGDARWYRALGHLRAWTRTHPGQDLPPSTVHGDFALGAWWRRTSTDAEAGRLDPRRRREADAARWGS